MSPSDKKKADERRQELRDLVELQDDLSDKGKRSAALLIDDEDIFTDEILIDDAKWPSVRRTMFNLGMVERGNATEMLTEVISILCTYLDRAKNPADVISEVGARVHQMFVGFPEHATRYGAAIAGIAIAAALIVPEELIDDHTPIDYLQRICETYLADLSGEAWAEKYNEFKQRQMEAEFQGFIDSLDVTGDDETQH